MRIELLAQSRIAIGCTPDDRGDLQNGSKRRQRRIESDGPGAQDALDIFAGGQASGRRCGFHFDGERRRQSGCQRLRLQCPTPSARQRNKLREGPPPNSRRTCLQVPSCFPFPPSLRANSARTVNKVTVALRPKFEQPDGQHWGGISNVVRSADRSNCGLQRNRESEPLEVKNRRKFDLLG